MMCYFMASDKVTICNQRPSSRNNGKCKLHFLRLIRFHQNVPSHRCPPKTKLKCKPQYLRFFSNMNMRLITPIILTALLSLPTTRHLLSNLRVIEILEPRSRSFVLILAIENLLLNLIGIQCDSLL